MKVYITDICGDMCPENVTIGKADRELTERVKARVFEDIGLKGKAKSAGTAKKTLRTVLLAAVIASLLSVTAYAVNYTMNLREVDNDEPVTGYWRFVNEDGSITEEQKLVYPNASMVLTFEGPGEQYNRPELRCFWLPDGAGNLGLTDEEGWTKYIGDFGGDSGEIPYIISVGNVATGNSKLVLSGKAEVVKEEDWGAWHLTEIVSDYSETSFRNYLGIVNYVLLFDAERGFLVEVKGAESMETLVHIARELEVRESDEPPFDSGLSESIGIMEPGRG